MDATNTAALDLPEFPWPKETMLDGIIHTRLDRPLWPFLA
jgi:hypothetical protein